MTLLLCLCAGASHAGDFRPGSVGYLRDSCRAAFNYGSAAKFSASYCAGFIEGYITGFLNANWITLAEKRGDPCRKEKKAAYGRINDRFCPALKKRFTLKFMADPFMTTVELFFRWTSFASPRTLRQPATERINDVLRDPEFCSYLGDSRNDGNFVLEVNPAVAAFDWKSYIGDKSPKLLLDSYYECKDALDRSKRKPEAFAKTRCAAVITGYIAGIHSTQHIQNRAPAPGACGKELDRLYKNLDIPGSTCTPADTDPLRVAKVFIGLFEADPETKAISYNGANLAQSPIKGYGAAGYRTIYFGKLCSHAGQ